MGSSSPDPEPKLPLLMAISSSADSLTIKPSPRRRVRGQPHRRQPPARHRRRTGLLVAPLRSESSPRKLRAVLVDPVRLVPSPEVRLSMPPATHCLPHQTNSLGPAP